MGLFNELIITTEPPRSIQFKYARTWQLVYHLGDTIEWDRLERPHSADGKVIIAGICKEVNSDKYSYYAIEIINDIISNVNEITLEDYESLEKATS